MEPRVCDLVKQGTIAVGLFDHPDRELYDFAVYQLSEMLDQFKAQYYTTPRNSRCDLTPASPARQRADVRRADLAVHRPAQGGQTG